MTTTYVLGTRERFTETRCDLHIAGCRDIERAGYAYVDVVDGVEDAVEAGLVSDASDVTVKPCALEATR